MSRVAFLLPKEDMLPLVNDVAGKYHFELCQVQTVPTAEVVDTALNAVANGADIVVARGFQAELIRAGTKIPLVYIKSTAQEVAMLIQKAKSFTDKPYPRIALVGFLNMFQDVSHLGDLMGVDLRTFFIDHYSDKDNCLEHGVDQALRDGADVIIGGDVVCLYSQNHGIPSIFIESSRECIENACIIAQRMAYALDQEKRSRAQMQSILDYTVNGLILIDTQGTVQQLNLSSEHMLDRYQQDTVGKAVWEVLPALSANLLSEVLENGQELNALHFYMGDKQVAASVSPINSADEITGAVISITDPQQLKLYNNQERLELYRQGFSAPFTFETIVAQSPKMLSVLEKAKRCAPFRAPVLILGEFGTERRELAQCIHNAGENKENALIQFRCSSADPKTVEEKLFAPDGLVAHAQGTIFLDDVSYLSRAAQSKLISLTSRRPVPPGATDFLPRLRVLAGDSRDLTKLAEQDEFDRELYYALSVTVLSIPPLRQRPEDVAPLADYFLRIFQKRHGRYIHLTKTAWQRLRDHSWPGNMAELSSACQSIVVNAPRRTVDEVFLETIIASSAKPPDTAETAAVIYRDPGAAQIAELLSAYHGSRHDVANALGISTTTLWRRMKKYGIQT